MIDRRESPAAIAFDCDSTLSTLEGIDELAVRSGRADEIVPLTEAAMDGRMAIDEVYGRRMEILRPSLEDIIWLGERYAQTIVQGAAQAIARLKAAGAVVYVISGGLRAPVVHLANKLGVAEDRVHAVAVYHDTQGQYAGFDAASPLTRSDGKARISARLVAEHGNVVLVGDGATDVAAREGGATVIGFGGVARRPAVVAGADHFIDGPSLTAVADYLIG
ncbi:MAG: HAD-IB family phosphatase [Hyphomicrobiaceae bacterium]|nr:HAD-IB family phosphatase [Hyphomicrobiaceae bacterium]